jgi:hypothetical protein
MGTQQNVKIRDIFIKIETGMEKDKKHYPTDKELIEGLAKCIVSCRNIGFPLDEESIMSSLAVFIALTSTEDKLTLK